MVNEELRRLYLEIRDVYELSQRTLDKYMDNYGITLVQFGVLKSIPEKKMISIKELVQKVGCVPSNMTTMLQRMMRDDLVKSIKNPQDYRETLVYLTKKGENVSRTLEPVYEQFLKESYGHLTEEEQQNLEYLLSKLKQNLTQK
ncbi:MarR family transcriptional regulator [Paenibacillus alginolyticus]|uniref:MarR family winged helix-turn-helix transcriptional regulator n=1 Tax=Paenibacillus alginolyticus TaxID=59839 RepID=UPI0004267BDF|nr:MarR family transcriptional regulator [Paenibacillus alginolyticus]MCY9666498.1 MarR family transcriptional regulator [Paenibacillus alginolyticus]